MDVKEHKGDPLVISRKRRATQYRGFVKDAGGRDIRYQRGVGKRRRYITSGQNQCLRIRTLGCLPPRCRLKMGYADTYVMDGGGAATTAQRIYRTNAVWDPDYSGTGVTVTGYSTFAALYGRYFVHGSKVEIKATIRDSTAIATDACNVMLGVGVSDYVLIAAATNWDTELLLERYKLTQMPRGTSFGGLYRMSHKIVSRNTAATAVAVGAANLDRYVSRAQGPCGFYFTDNRRYHLDDPLATLVTGGMIEHEYNGEYPLTAPYNNTPLDNVFATIWAFSLPDTNAAALPLPTIYWTVNIIYDVEWYAPTGVAAPQAAAAGAGAGIDATQA